MDKNTIKDIPKIKPVLSKHCLGTIVTNKPGKLYDGRACLDFVKSVVENKNVQHLGEELHQFANKSFTIVVVLAESHISIHTWPERLTVQLDVFLCNYMHDNTKKCEEIYDAIVEYFDPVENNVTYIERP